MKNHVITLLILIATASISRADTYHLSDTGQVTFSREDNISLSIYSWPRTLVTYHVTFDSPGISAGNLRLTDDRTGRATPFQLSGVIHDSAGHMRSANVNFFAELPSGGRYSYTLQACADSNRQPHSGVEIRKGARSWQLGNEDFMVEIPAAPANGGSDIPAPVMSINAGGRSTGCNHLISPGRKVTGLTATVIENGDLFVECGVRYTFDNGASYLTKVKVVDGYPFVILDEEINGLSAADSVSLDMSWTGFSPTRRYGNWDRQKEMSPDGGLPIDRPIHTNWCQEDPHWTGQGWIENPSRQMLYRLLPFGGNSTREQVPAIAFWETGMDARELGVFVYDHNRWDDRQYGIWQPTPDLCVYFRYTDSVLHFKYPIVDGTRSTAISMVDVSSTKGDVDLFNSRIDEIAAQGGADSSDEMGFRYAMMLHRQYGLLNLNTVKDWILDYPTDASHPQSPFAARPQSATASQFYHEITTSPLAYYMTGLNGFPGIHSISHRMQFGKWTQDYLELYKQLTPEQLSTVNGLFLISAYVNTLEAMNAIRTSLAGTANMAADGWAVPGQMSFIFPEHPMAEKWADFFEKSLEIYGIFYTRPDVKTYGSNGGRWVESPGIYNWAFLRPTSATQTALLEYDGKNRFANAPMAKRGRWMLDMLTAPVFVKGQDGKLASQRSYAPHGAHGGGRIVPRYCQVRQLADWMTHYDPMLAESLLWTGDMGPAVESKPAYTDWIALHNKQYSRTNRGTNPHLRSTKYTGHGIVLRAGVDTDEELSIHLNQVDKGPNYRWGHQGQGNAGGIYFYAKGKIYTGHENEAAGDHMQDNLDGVTNFGVMKNGAFHNIGMNELVAPLYDLDIVQLAELRSAEGKGSFAWPEYLSRSIMLVGTDYFLIYDETGTNWRAGARFSWFVQKEDEYPQIVFFGKKARADHWTKSETNHAHGFYRDADGSLLTLVTHKKGEVKVIGGKSETPMLMSGSSVYEFVPDKETAHAEGIIDIRAPHSNDMIFRNSAVITHSSPTESFNGTAGVIRRNDDGSLQLALMKGTAIAADGIGMALSEQGTAIAVTRTPDGTCSGRFKSDGKASLTISGLTGGHLFIDGVRQSGPDNVKLPAGEHLIEYAREATPLPAIITGSEYSPKGATIYLDIPVSTKKVRIETSTDNGTTWYTAGVTSRPEFRMKPQSIGKIHVRALGLNGSKCSPSAQEYPVYSTSEAPHYPDGLRVRLTDGDAHLSWGEVLGTRIYRLYRREAGHTDFNLIYEGDNREFTDKGISGKLYEYTIRATNGYGESADSPIVNTDPGSWANWYPDTELRYKRTSAFWMPPYVPAEQSPAKYYPD